MNSHYSKLTNKITWAFLFLGIVITLTGGFGFHYLEGIRLYQLQFEDEWEEYQRMVSAEELLKGISVDISAWEASMIPVTQLKAKSKELIQVLNSWASDEQEEEQRPDFILHEKEEAKLLAPARQAFIALTNDIAALPTFPTATATAPLIHSLNQLQEASQPLRQFYFESIQSSLLKAKKARFKAERGSFYFILIVTGLLLTISIFSIKVLKSQTKKLVEQERLIASVELVQHLAHEIRNPLGIVKSAASIIAQRTDGEVAVLAGDISSEVVRIDALLMDLLHLQRVESKPKVMTDISALVAKVSDLLATKLRETEIRLDIFDQAHGVLCPCHPDSIKQVLINLLYNAIEASERTSSIEIKTEVVGREYLLQVRDHGCGLTAEQKNKIFDFMYTTKPYGFGIGLTVVKNIIESHHGRIEVSSSFPEQGTTFSIYLPLRA